jgi:uncharacterized protein (TIGR02266 family)
MPSKPRVLIVEDEEQVRNLLKASLSTQDYEILDAANGQEGVEVFFQTPCDLVVMDLNMPQMDGCQAIEQIRLMEGGKEIPIIVLTALDSPEWEEKAKRAGASLFLTKPFRPKDVLHCLRTLLNPSPVLATKRKKKNTPIVDFKIRYKTQEGFMNCYLRNLMENRSFIATDHLLPLGSKFQFEITPPQGGKPFHVLGTVKWVNLYADQKGMGVEFTFPNPQDRERVQKWINEMNP